MIPGRHRSEPSVTIGFASGTRSAANAPSKAPAETLNERQTSRATAGP